jgi:hypothetical protein
MGSGIIKGKDKGAVGFRKELGLTWHGQEEYEVIDGPVLMPMVRDKIVYDVETVALCPQFTGEQIAKMTANGMGETEISRLMATPIPSMRALTRMDSGDVLYDYSVTPEYTVILNGTFLDVMQENLLDKFPDVAIESCGTLFAGRVAFVNILLSVKEIRGDNSKTAFRLMYYNAFGGKSIAAGMHTVRVVCFNTLSMAEAQALANKTLAKFKHSSGAPGRVQTHLVELAGLYAQIEAHKTVLDQMAVKKMSETEVAAFLSMYSPIPKGSTSNLETRRLNKRNDIRGIFEGAPDLQGDIARSYYAMLQACTFYNEHFTTGKRGIDEAAAIFDSVTGGIRDQDNRKAFALLQLPNLSEASLTAQSMLDSEE